MIHWTAAKRVLRYLKGTKHQGITYRKGDNCVHGYADASFASNEDMSSTNGNVFILNGGAITWSSKRQRTIALSTAEAEYTCTSMVDAAREIIWLQNLYNEIGHSQNEVTELFGDNQSAIAIVTNLQYHKRSKHFEIKNHYLRQQIHAEKIKLSYCPTDKMTADILTKALPRARHEQHCQALGLYVA